LFVEVAEHILCLEMYCKPTSSVNQQVHMFWQALKIMNFSFFYDLFMEVAEHV